MIVFTDGALADLERIFEFVAGRDPFDPLEHIDKIRSAITVLEDHPRIGQKISSRSSMRELIISRGASGYVALYEYSPGSSHISILAIRHQREAGYFAE